MTEDELIQQAMERGLVELNGDGDPWVPAGNVNSFIKFILGVL